MAHCIRIQQTEAANMNGTICKKPVVLIPSATERAKVAADKAERVRSGQVGNWRIIAGGIAPVIVSQARIVRAIESGEYVGFCRECGHKHYSVEPDARNYPCEKC